MLFWIHELSQSALAAAVLALGLVMLLELRSLVRLRRAVDGNLERVFEQLDLLRFENQQLLEAQSSLSASRTEVAVAVRSHRPTPIAVERAAAAPNIVAPAKVTAKAILDEPIDRSSLGTGEARLLASLAAARARRAPPESVNGGGVHAGISSLV